MKKLLRLVALVLAICTVLPCLAHMPVKTQAATASGICGNNLYWSLDANLLTISGTGDMFDYSITNPAPWSSHSFSRVKIQEGATSIGTYAFYNMDDVVFIGCPASLKRVRENAFAWEYVTNLRIGFINGDVIIADNAFTNRKVIVYTVYNQEKWQEPPTYGGRSLTHYPADIAFELGTKDTYAPNEAIKPEDFLFRANLPVNLPYTPKQVQIGAYDNSTSGQKTVTVTVDGHTLTHTYMVTDGTSHLAQITVDFPNYIVYNGSNRPYPRVYDGDIRLEKDEDYKLTYTNYTNVTDSATVTITGIGKYEGYEKTLTYTIVRRDLSDHYLVVEDAEYTALPVSPKFSVHHMVDGYDYTTNAVTYQPIIEQNVNLGQGFVRAVGIGNDYGAPTGNFQINLGSEYIKLPGHYMGQADGELDGQTMVSETWLAPGQFTGCVEATGLNIAYYELHKMVNWETGETIPVTTYTSDVNFSAGTTFSYDFSSVYNDNTPEGVTCYILGYEWIDEAGGYYSGVMILYIVNKVPDASTMVLEQIPEDEDFRHDYLTVYSEDGALQKATWSVSDSSIATVDQGAITFLKPGSVTVSVSCGKLTAQKTLTAEMIAMEDTTILDWDSETGAVLMYDYILLKEGIDYTATAKTVNGIVTVTAEGKGLFEGTVTRKFDAVTGRPLDDTSPVLPNIPGDINGDTVVNNDDVVSLLWHTLFPVEYPIATNGDLTQNGSVDNDDVVLLLWHSLFPKDYPL